MTAENIHIKARDGVASCYFASPLQKGPHPAIILYMDAFGIRPAMYEMAEHYARNGYYVLLPNLYYRAGRITSFKATAFSDEQEKARLMPLYQSLNNRLVMEDTAYFLDFLLNYPFISGQKIGAVGYCMSGGMALSAAGTFPDKITAAASIHGVRLATDASDSPHLLLSRMRGEIYIGVAGMDPSFTSAEQHRLETACKVQNVKYTIEVYQGKKHGFAVNDHPAFDKQASEKHWEAVLNLFAGNLAIGQQAA